MTQPIVALVSGLLFAIGLGVSGMTRPSKVIGFLDLFGEWDPSLMAVMVGAIGVNTLAWAWGRRQTAPILGGSFQVPTRRDLDPRLIAGAAIFGVGWGLAGYCPGPAITSLASGGATAAAFLGAMLLGMRLHSFVDARLAAARRT